MPQAGCIVKRIVIAFHAADAMNLRSVLSEVSKVYKLLIMRFERADVCGCAQEGRLR